MIRRVDRLRVALEAAEAERDEALRKQAIAEAGAKIGGDVLYERWQAAETENRRLREALERAQAIQPRTLAMLREKGIVFRHAPKPNPEDSFELVAFWIYNDLCEADMIARAALSGSGE